LGAADEIVLYRLIYPSRPLTALMALFTRDIVLRSSFPIRNEPF